jgi:hypothetical protein
MSRVFQVCPGRTVTLPQGLQAGPGKTNMRLEEGCAVELDEESCVQFGRFIEGRKRAEDWKELDAMPAGDTPAPKYVPAPEQRSMEAPKFAIDMTTTKKEG